jgi:glutaminase
MKIGDPPSQVDRSSNVQELYAQLQPSVDESFAYIPELATTWSEWFGSSVTTLDSHVYGSGDCQLLFTIQSVSNPSSIRWHFRTEASDPAHECADIDPLGDSFKCITTDAVTGRPFNPMVNADAVVTTSLVASLPCGVPQLPGRTR